MTRPDAYAPLTTPEQKQQRFEESLLLVKYVVGRLAVDLPPTIDREDLCSYGAIGLWRAVQTYDSTRGVAFSTHAYIHIRGAILDELRRLDYLPRSRRDRLRFLNEHRTKLEQELGRPAMPDELATASGLSQEEVDETLLSERTMQLLSIEDSTEEGGLLAVLRSRCEEDPSNVVERNELRDRLAAAIAQLPLVERRVVTLYYAENLLLKEIGEVLGFSESRASQIHARALARLKTILVASPGEPQEAEA
ncbi:MAG: FliA/WhiG family RNA polymerase sigma factor [Planctomycetes bacterium]|nr:FliA/WhiG family RNA polymerase sigma factor [Planctomycetota bacterium]